MAPVISLTSSTILFLCLFYDTCAHVCVLSHVQFFAVLWTVTGQTHLSMGFPRQEHWSGWPLLLLRIFSTQGFHLRLLYFLHWQVDPLPVSHLGSPLSHSYVLVIPGISHTYCFPSNLPASGSSLPRYLCDYFTLFETSLKNLSLSPHLYYLLAFNTGHVLIYLIYCQLPQLEHNSHEVCFSFPLIFPGLNKFWTNSTNLSCLEREH